MTARIFTFHGDSSIPHSPEMALNEASRADLQNVIILGWDQDGEFRSFTSSFDGPTACWLLDRAKHLIMQKANELEERA